MEIQITFQLRLRFALSQSITGRIFISCKYFRSLNMRTLVGNIPLSSPQQLYCVGYSLNQICCCISSLPLFYHSTSFSSMLAKDVFSSKCSYANQSRMFISVFIIYASIWAALQDIKKLVYFRVLLLKKLSIFDMGEHIFYEILEMVFSIQKYNIQLWYTFNVYFLHSLKSKC